MGPRRCCGPISPSRPESDAPMLDTHHMSFDLSGIATSLGRGEIERWNRTILGLLSHAAAAGPDLAAVIEASPDFALGHAIKGFAALLLGRAEMVSTAHQAHAAARAALLRVPATARERAFVDALQDWLQGYPGRAATRLEAELGKVPGDALAMKLVQAIWFVLGRPDLMRQSIEAALPGFVDHSARGYALGCHAFTLEEAGEYARAEAIGREGVELCPPDAWGLHAVAHVHDMQGRAHDGLDWLSGRETSWTHCNNFRFHVWWHRALLHLDLGQYDMALHLYDRDIRAERTDDYRDISNAASLLMRLELEGVSVGHRWDELADLSERRADDGCLAFADLHYMLALMGGGRETAVARLVGRMAAARMDAGEAEAIIAQPGATAAQGLAAFAAGDHQQAWMHLSSVQHDLPRIGGSHAQRDIFVRLAIEAAIRSGRLDAAESLLAGRQAMRGGAWDGYADRRRHLIAAARDAARQGN